MYSSTCTVLYFMFTICMYVRLYVYMYMCMYYVCMNLPFTSDQYILLQSSLHQNTEIIGVIDTMIKHVATACVTGRDRISTLASATRNEDPLVSCSGGDAPPVKHQAGEAHDAVIHSSARGGTVW